jgi:hypothetical protein
MLTSFLLALTTLFGLIEIEAPAGSLTVRTIREKRTPYWLLTKEDPITFEVEGPIYVRIFTRILYEKGDTGEVTYKLILQQDELRERIIQKTTVPSKVSFYDDRPVGKWRSIPLDVPPGKHQYRIFLHQSPYPIAVRIVQARPPKWIPIPLGGVGKEITAVENEKLVRYHLIKPEATLRAKIEGPTLLKVEVRTNFTPQMDCKDQFTVLIFVDGKDTKREDFVVYPSDVVSWRERPELKPSQKVSTTAFVQSGKHKVEVKVLGTLSPFVSVRLLREEAVGP